MKKILHIVSVYSIIHFIVDFACSFLLAGVITPIVSNTYELFIGVLLYNLFAFAFQLPFGIIADKLNKNALVSVLGCMCVVLAYLVFPISILACVVAGIGNALFHVGGGIDVLNISEKKASLLGVYVAPGALGLFLGSKVFKYGFNKIYILILLIISILVLLHLYKNTKSKYNISNETPKLIIVNKRVLILICLLITVCVRGYIGLILNFSWKSDFNIALLFVLGVVFGKILGGFIGDRFGLMKTSVVSLVVSSFLLIFSFNNAIIGVIAIILFNMTMPITLIALSNTFNNNKGFAFGLTTFALFIGSIPVLFGYNKTFFNPLDIFIIVILSSIVLYYGLKKYNILMESCE